MVTQMKRWHFKAAAQGLIALLPYRQRVNRVFQTRVSRTLDLSPPRMDYIL